MIRHKKGGEPAKPTLPDIDDGSASVNLQEIHEAVAKARAHAAQWLAYRENMAQFVAEYEALTPTLSPSTGSILAAPMPSEKK
ncbi:hypothetical protein EBBID32_23500 [Sphingobium indicum BiD32]|uniref:Uncharacterized protein n=1 Tax=Sphingobium indicum BiD32 TaxID=1301087 RepID=N1ML79_9SPHN|nr:hypothetical protein [Sphingobium indicum]CCW18000.1 hypothetical protein EBBID32_23500 [Sphingobium indicum BiD32]